MNWKIGASIRIIGIQIAEDEWINISSAHISDVHLKGDVTTIRMSSGKSYAFSDLKIRSTLKEIGWLQ